MRRTHHWLRRSLWAVALVPMLGLGCGSEDEAGPDEPSTVEYLTPTQHLVRASMALRGTRPSLDDLHAVAADPSVLPTLVDKYMETPEFGQTIRDLHNDQLLLRVDFFFFSAVGFIASEGYTASEVNQSVFEEPLRLIENVVMNNRPYTEIVTADYTMANRITAGIWGLPYDQAGPEWQKASYTDGRPRAGILSTSALFARHMSAGFNYNRGRANMVSTALLCYDFLERDAAIDGRINLSDPELVSRAVTTEPLCAGCHQTLDPLASYLWGYEPLFVPQLVQSYPVALYRPEEETRWQRTTMRPPGFFGDQGGGLDDLGTKLAGDPRFAQCAARRFYSYFAGVEVDEVPFNVVTDLQQAFEDSDYSAKALARAAVLSDAFRASHATGEAEAETVVGMKKTRPEQLDRMMFDLTGFRWETDLPIPIGNSGLLGKVDLATTDVLGYRTLAGGIDSFYTTRPTRTVNVTSSLFLRAYAAEAAGFVVEKDLAAASPTDKRLLTRVSETDTGEAAARAQLADLHLRLYAEDVAPGSAEVGETYALFKATLDRTGDVRHAWKTVLTAMLQDVEIAYY